MTNLCPRVRFRGHSALRGASPAGSSTPLLVRCDPKYYYLHTLRHLTTPASLRMWKGRLLSILKRSAPSSVAAGAALSCILVAQQDTQPQFKKDEDSSSLSRSVDPWTPSLFQQSHTLFSLNVTECDEGRRRAILARRETVRLIEDTSSQSTLESRYKVDWDHPLGEGSFGTVLKATDRKVSGRHFVYS